MGVVNFYWKTLKKNFTPSYLEIFWKKIFLGLTILIQSQSSRMTSKFFCGKLSGTHLISRMEKEESPSSRMDNPSFTSALELFLKIILENLACARLARKYPGNYLGKIFLRHSTWKFFLEWFGTDLTFESQNQF